MIADAVAARLLVLLQTRGVRWPAPIEHLESLGSTSDRLKERWRGGAPAWSVVLADQQTAGRGRHGHVWLSPPGNLYLSVLLGPPITPRDAVLVPLAAGVAVAEGVAAFGLDARLKWPNDVVVADRKLAGMLAEGMAGPGSLEAIVLGVGVNVALDPSSLPPELLGRTTSLAAETARAIEPVEVAAEVLARLTVWYHALAQGDGARVLSAWRARSVPWWGKTVEVRSGGDVIRGVARGVDERGALLLDSDGGERAVVLSGEAHEVRLR